jgi:hypothetical protein
MTINNDKDTIETQSTEVPDVPKVTIKPGNLDNNAREAYTYLVNKGIPK